MQAEDSLSQRYSGIYLQKMFLIAIQEKNPTLNETKHIDKRQERRKAIMKWMKTHINLQ